LKGEKKWPKFKPSRMEQQAGNERGEERGRRKARQGVFLRLGCNPIPMIPKI
jgi:hypothetical protein